MKKIKYLIKSRHKIIPHIKVKSIKYYCISRYLWEKKRGINPQIREVEKIKKHLKTKDDKELQVYIKKNMSFTLVSSKINRTIDKFASNKGFLESMKKSADHTCSNRFLILWKIYEDVYDEVGGCYRWNKDFNSGFEYDFIHFTKINSNIGNINDGKDIKIPWEMSRMQYLFAPSLMWRITGDSKYSKFVCNVILDWIKCNRYEEGPNWSNAMEVGIRISNMLLAFQLICNDENLPDKFFSEVVASASLHLKFILENKEKYAGRSYNHYIANLLGIVSICATFPFLKHSKRHISFAVSELECEINKQILEDGGNFEGAICYHGLVGEMFAVCALICVNSGIYLSPNYFDRLDKAVKFAISVEKHTMLFPQVGDNDSGRVFVLNYYNPLCYRPFINLGYWLTNRGKIFSDVLLDEILCFIGIDNDKITEENNSTMSCFFKDSRIAVFKSKDIYVLISSIDANRFDLGGHTHNDKLSIEVAYKGEDFIVDPGSGCYTPIPSIHQQLRSVRSHSTLNVNSCEHNRNQTTGIFGSSYNTITELGCQKTDGNTIAFFGSAYVKHEDFEYVHSRELGIETHNHKLRILDSISAESGSKICLRFVLHPQVKVIIKGKKAYLTNNKASIIINSFADIYLEEGFYSKSYGFWEKTKILYLNTEHLDQKSNYITEIEFNP